MIYKEIPLYDTIKNNKDKLELNDEEQYSVASLAIDDDGDGDFLFIGYKNGIIITIYLNLNFFGEDSKIGRIYPNKNKINNILYENKFYEYYYIGDNKGFKMRKINENTLIFEDNSAGCHSLCFDKKNNYLFAGFGDGIIKVYHLENND